MNEIFDEFYYFRLENIILNLNFLILKNLQGKLKLLLATCILNLWYNLFKKYFLKIKYKLDWNKGISDWI